MAEINETTTQYSERVAKHFTIDKEGKPTVNEHAFVETAPEGVTREMIEAVYTHRDNFIAGATHAAGLASNEAAKKHKSIEEIAFTFPLGGKDTYNLEWTRSKEVPNGIGVRSHHARHHANRDEGQQRPDEGRARRDLGQRQGTPRLSCTAL
jgi:hypothetical protein